MSLFQCSRCGCIENTACTWCYHSTDALDQEDNPAMASYRQILGLKPGEKAGHYCSACCPVWFDKKGNYGIGPCPTPSPDRFKRGEGCEWHGRFERTFLPKGMFETNREGNLAHKKTGDTDTRKYQLSKEEGT